MECLNPSSSVSSSLTCCPAARVWSMTAASASSRRLIPMRDEFHCWYSCFCSTSIDSISARASINCSLNNTVSTIYSLMVRVSLIYLVARVSDCCAFFCIRYMLISCRRRSAFCSSRLTSMSCRCLSISDWVSSASAFSAARLIT